MQDDQPNSSCQAFTISQSAIDTCNRVFGPDINLTPFRESLVTETLAQYDSKQLGISLDDTQITHLVLPPPALLGDTVTSCQSFGNSSVRGCFCRRGSGLPRKRSASKMYLHMEHGHDKAGHDRLGTLTVPARPVPALSNVAPDLASYCVHYMKTRDSA
ncbi:hypothetical protein HZ326_1385 [Fusarium oxysporum f. sp. albedinis]|nr:hypothetical protein HZ326_1385 [Fusarium oxysporum f. sp. albedinis]